MQVNFKMTGSILEVNFQNHALHIGGQFPEQSAPHWRSMLFKGLHIGGQDQKQILLVNQGLYIGGQFPHFNMKIVKGSTLEVNILILM